MSTSANQGLFYYDTQTHEQLIAGQNAKLFIFENGVWRTLSGWTLTDAARVLDMAQGVDKVLITDGAANMRSWDGAALTDLGSTAGTTTSDPPVGATIVCWHPGCGRMFASGKPGANDTLWASFVIQFGSSQWNHTQFSLRVGSGEGDPIKALAVMQNYVMCVLKENSVYLVLADPSAPTAAGWIIQRVAGGLGCVGRDAWCYSGNDVLFMSQDGVRSVARMQAAAGQYEVGPPLSRPMQSYIDRINWRYAGGITAKNYKELCLFSVPLDGSTTNNYTLVFNSRLERWIGVWTGWKPVAFEVARFAGAQSLVFGETNGRVRQWKDTQDQTDDDTFLEDSAAIASKLWTRSMLFGEPVNDKDAYHAEVRFSAANAMVNVRALGDGADLRVWTHDVLRMGPTLPVDLPFFLVSPAAVTGRRGLRGVTPFNEVFLKIESSSGWWELQSVTLSAYLNMLQNQ